MYQGFLPGLSCPLVHTWATEGFYCSCCGCRGDGPCLLAGPYTMKSFFWKSCGHSGHWRLQHPERLRHSCGIWYIAQPQSKTQQSFKWSFLPQGWRVWSLFISWKEVRMLIVVKSGTAGVQLHIIKNQSFWRVFQENAFWDPFSLIISWIQGKVSGFLSPFLASLLPPSFWFLSDYIRLKVSRSQQIISIWCFFIDSHTAMVRVLKTNPVWT